MGAIEDLKAHGIMPGEDLKHVNPGESVPDVHALEYFDAVAAKLPTLVETIEGSVAEELDVFANRWNPGGFMVFPLGLHRELGSLRLHVWPTEEQRKVIEGGPHIHSHGWHLASLVLRGTYRDELYDIRETDENTGLRLYTQQRIEGGRDKLTTDGVNVEPIVVDRRAIAEGGIHTIVSGVLHKPTVKDDDHSITLVFDSKAISTHTKVVMPDASNNVSRVRQPITPEDVALARTLIAGK